MNKLFHAFLWCLIAGMTFVNVYAQQASQVPKPEKQYTPYVMNPEAECTGSGELIYDDGVFENGYGWNPTVSDGRFVSLFTPLNYPWQFNTFCLSLTRVATSPADFTFDIVVYDGNGGGVPGTLVATISGVTATAIPIYPSFAFYDYDVSSIPQLASGSYYIGIKYDPSIVAAPHYSAADESPTTALHPGYAYDGTSWSTIQTLFTAYRALGYRTLGSGGSGPGPATDPMPADGATDVDINQDISWTNPGGETSVEVFWGTDPGSLTSVYSGAPISSFDPGTLDYLTDYYWKIAETDGAGTTNGPTWHFTTMQDPSIVTLYLDDFESGTGNWTITTANGCPWDVIPISSRPYTLPATAQGNAFASDADLCGSSGGGSSSTAVLTNPIDATNYQSVGVEWDNDWQAINSADFAYVDVSVDGGATWMNVVTFDVNDVRNTHEFYNISSMVGTQTFMLRLVSVQPAWDWWWAIDNLQVTGWDFVPVELSSFTANNLNGNVVLNWTTASETNNKGFEVQRSTGGEYQTIGFVQGNGTSTQQHSYAYSDQNVVNGNYSYRLRQVDFDGSSEYSKVVEVSVNSPVEFSLAQNYPNPFNPSTKINYALKVDSKVTLKVFDVLGQQVATLLNENIAAGAHNVTFDASKLNSGVYLYKIEANGVDGSSFTSVKKMILTK